jgi:hypothetical protein
MKETITLGTREIRRLRVLEGVPSTGCARGHARFPGLR